MIKNIPPPQEFYEAGLSLLNFAWETVTALLIELNESEEAGLEVDEIKNAFWSAARQHLTTSLAIAQQGVEFILKGRISEISPFLLIDNLPKDFPKGSTSNDLNFSDFRTIDSQDLIKIHDTFSSERLPVGFQDKFEDLRKKRNSIMHTVNKNLVVQATDVISDILSVHKYMFPDRSFISFRRNALDTSPTSELYSNDHVDSKVIREFSLVIDLLPPNLVKEFFGFNKKQRRYICPTCNHACADSYFIPETAFLIPNTATANTLFCFICKEKHPVERTTCFDEKCKGNVRSIEYDMCVTCGRESNNENKSG
jgi:hypothetical protein